MNVSKHLILDSYMMLVLLKIYYIWEKFNFLSFHIQNILEVFSAFLEAIDKPEESFLYNFENFSAHYSVFNTF